MRKVKHYLEPLGPPGEARPFIVFDIESKHDDTQRAGFTRPFMVGIYDGREFITFRNDPAVETLPWNERAIAPGGCIDKFLRFVFGETDSGRYTLRYPDHDIYAHNAGAFDALFLPAWLMRQERRYSFKIVPVQSRIQSMEVWRHTSTRPRKNYEERKQSDRKDRKTSGTWKFLDSYRVMPISLDELSKTFGLGGKLEHDLHMPEDDPTWNDYNRVDCEHLYIAIDKWRQLIRSMGGDLGITAPATAMKLLRMKYIPEELKIHRNIHFPTCKGSLNDGTLCEGCAHEFFRAAYYGGRTEIYERQGEGWYYDINSSYPYSMKGIMPIGEMNALGENEDFTHFSDSDYVGFLKCTIEIPETTYLPPLPIVHGGKLKFPAGRFSGTWDWTEVKELRRIGGKVLHVEKSVWIKGQRFLVDFVETLYAMRNKKYAGYDPGKAAAAKLLLNSTFGKFGMEQERTELIIMKPGEEEPRNARYPGEARKHAAHRKEMIKAGEWKPPENIEGSSIGAHDSLVRVRDTRIDAPYIIPQIAAHITASSRMLLWNFSMDILDRGGRIFYSDTDSVLTDLNDIPDSTELGGLKKEFNGEKLYVYCYAPKMYLLRKETPFPGEHIRKNTKRVCDKKCPGCSREKIMMKGFPRDLKTSETLAKLENKEEVSYEMHEKLGALAKKGLLTTPLMQTVKKSFKSEYDKREVFPDGSTKPLFIDSPTFLSTRFRELATLTNYVPPVWLEKALHY